jgi:hypothetical protein
MLAQSNPDPRRAELDNIVGIGAAIAEVGGLLQRNSNIETLDELAAALCA